MRGLTLSAAATAPALFLLYTNWPVVASQRGIVPAATVVLVPLLLALAAIHQLVIRRRPLVIDRTLLLMVGFLGVLLLSAVPAQGYDRAFERIAVFVSEGLLIYFLVRQSVRSLTDLRIAILATLAAAGLLAGLTVFQSVTGNYEQEFMGLVPRTLEHLEGPPASAREEISLEDRARGPVDEPNRFAQILLMAGALAVVRTLNAAGKRGTVIGWLFVGLLMAGVLLTYSRGALVALVALLVVAVPLRLMRPRHLVGVLAIGGITVFTLVPGMAERAATMVGVAGLFGSAQVEADGPTRGRTTAMLSALAAYTDHPVLGVGPGQYTAFHAAKYQSLPEISFREIAEPRRAHNLYLEMAAETGTVGLAVFLAIPFLLLLDLRGLRLALYWRDRPDLARLATGFTLVLLAYLGTGIFLHLAYERYYWIMVALTACAVGALREWVCEDATYSDLYRYQEVGPT